MLNIETPQDLLVHKQAAKAQLDALLTSEHGFTHQEKKELEEIYNEYLSRIQSLINRFKKQGRAIDRPPSIR